MALFITGVVLFIVMAIILQYVSYQGCSRGGSGGFGRTPSLLTVAMNYMHLGG